MTEIGIIGDIHGRLEPLVRLIDLALTRVPKLIFLGDYVNRGGESKAVVDYLLSLPAHGIDCVFLRGNHDQAFLDALDGQFDSFLLMGGAATVRSYVKPPYDDVEADLLAAVPERHREFLRALNLEYVTDSVRVAHAMPSLQDSRAIFRVGGHAPQAGSEPTVIGDAAYIDTGCGTLEDGRLTCFFWPSRTWISEAAPLSG